MRGVNDDDTTGFFFSGGGSVRDTGHREHCVCVHVYSGDLDTETFNLMELEDLYDTARHRPVLVRLSRDISASGNRDIQHKPSFDSSPKNGRNPESPGARVRTGTVFPDFRKFPGEAKERVYKPPPLLLPLPHTFLPAQYHTTEI